MNYFIDTWYWLTLLNKTETYHQKANEHYLKLNYIPGNRIYTSAAIIQETIGFILNVEHYIKAPKKSDRPKMAYGCYLTFKNLMDTPVANFSILIPTPEELYSARNLLKERCLATPGLGYVDCESAVLCKAHGIPKVLTGDGHFESPGQCRH